VVFEYCGRDLFCISQCIQCYEVLWDILCVLGNEQILVSVSVITTNNEGTKITLKISHRETPEKIIEQSIRHKLRTMNMTIEQREECVNQHRDKYVLKVCGYEEFLLGDFPLSQYKVY
jgi:hypothetical protein